MDGTSVWKARSTPFSGHDNVSPLEHPVPNQHEALYPDGIEEEQVFRTFEEAIAQIGPCLTFMSSVSFRREIWNAIMENEPPDLIHPTRHPLHICVLLLVMRASPYWVWPPARTVRVRTEKERSLGARPFFSRRKAANRIQRARGRSPRRGRRRARAVRLLIR